jgi:NADH dehydrogenase
MIECIKMTISSSNNSLVNATAPAKELSSFSKYQRIVVFGGTGFLGKFLVPELTKIAQSIVVVGRHPLLAEELKPMGNVGQIVPLYGDIRSKEDVDRLVKKADVVINLVGILFPLRGGGFNRIHAQSAEYLAKVCAKQGVKRLIHISALGVDQPSGSSYAISKLRGEEAVKAAFKGATIFRPSVIFGPGGGFLDLFARMARVSPFLPLIGAGKTRFSPVYAADVARAISVALQKPSTRGKTYELGGLEEYSLKDILKFVRRATSRCCLIVPIPFPIASLLGWFLKWLPTPPLTPDQVKLLHYDNTVDPDALSFSDLGIVPENMEITASKWLKF